MRHTINDAIGKILDGIIEEQKRAIIDLPDVNYDRHIELRGLRAFYRGIEAVLVTDEVEEVERESDRLGITLDDFRNVTLSVSDARDYYTHLINLQDKLRYQ